MSYDQSYELDERISSCKNYVRRPVAKTITASWRRGFETTTPYPIQALVKILFHFIARGHKATAFLPLFFNERLDSVAGSNGTTMVSEVEHFRELIRLKLIRFLPGENFANHLKYRTAKCLGILVTTQEAFYFDRTNSAGGTGASSSRNNEADNPGETGNDIPATTANTVTATDIVAAADTVTKDSCDLAYSTMVPEISLDKGEKLPVIIPLFRPYNHRLIISLDVIRWKKILEVDIAGVSIAQYNELLSEEQLTAKMQFELLEKLAEMFDDDGGYPCGAQDAEIVPLLRHALSRTTVAATAEVGISSSRTGNSLSSSFKDSSMERTKMEEKSPEAEAAPASAPDTAQQNHSRSASSSRSDLNSANTVTSKTL